MVKGYKKKGKYLQKKRYRKVNFLKAIKDYDIFKQEAYGRLSFPVNSAGAMLYFPTGESDGLNIVTISSILTQFTGNDSLVDRKKSFSYYRLRGVRILVTPNARNASLQTNNNASLEAKYIVINWGKDSGLETGNLMYGENRVYVKDLESTDVYIRSKDHDWYKTNQNPNGSIWFGSSQTGTSQYSPTWSIVFEFYIMMKNHSS